MNCGFMIAALSGFHQFGLMEWACKRSRVLGPIHTCHGFSRLPDSSLSPSMSHSRSPIKMGEGANASLSEISILLLQWPLPTSSSCLSLKPLPLPQSLFAPSSSFGNLAYFGSGSGSAPAAEMDICQCSRPRIRKSCPSRRLLLLP